MKLIGNKNFKNKTENSVKKHRRGGRAARTAAYILCSVLALILLAAGLYMLWERAPKPETGGLSKPEMDPARTAAPETNPPEDGPDESAVPGRDSKMYTFLICGCDAVGSNTDTMMVGRLDTKAHEINVVSIPRDTLVNIPQPVKKANTFYAYDLVSGGNGIDGLLDGVENLLGFRVDCYAVVSLSVVEQLVDIMGGVDYNVPIDMVYEDPDQNLHINISAGQQHLNGKQAVQVLRFRAGYPSADLGRIGTQQDFLMSVAKQMLTLGNIPNLPKLIKTVTENTKTNLTTDNLSFFVRQFLLCKSNDIHFRTMDWNDSCLIKGLSYVSVDIHSWLETVNNYLNPWSEKVTEQNVNLLTCHNGEFYSTMGYVAGGEDSFFDINTILPAKPPEDSAVTEPPPDESGAEEGLPPEESGREPTPDEGGENDAGGVEETPPETVEETAGAEEPQ